MTITITKEQIAGNQQSGTKIDGCDGKIRGGSSYDKGSIPTKRYKIRQGVQK